MDGFLWSIGDWDNRVPFRVPLSIAQYNVDVANCLLSCEQTKSLVRYFFKFRLLFLGAQAANNVSPAFSALSSAQVYPIVLMSFLRSCCKVFLGLFLITGPSCKFEVNLRNSQKHAKSRKIRQKSYQIHVGTTYLKVISAVGAA